jgi:predicted nucleic acid-binding protein
MRSYLAATALANGLTLVTRNAKDFKLFEGLPLLNPWD